MWVDFYTISSESRLYWPYLLSSFVIVIAFIGPSKILKKSYWLNKSLFIDLKILLFNRFIKALFILPFESWLIFSLTKKTLILTGGAVIFQPLWSDSLRLLVFSLSFFIFDDFLKFFQHMSMHRVPFLWRFHRVHHSAHTLNPLTLYRVHIIEVLISSFRRAFSTISISALFLTLTGEFVTFYEILGAHAFHFIFNLVGGNLRHSHVPLSFGVLEHIFISPAQHQLHHSRSKKDYNQNYGICFSFWDKLFGSFKRGSSRQKIKFGLTYTERKALGSEWSTLVSGPFSEIFDSIKLIKKDQPYIFKSRKT
jgi:sterol desaturase/sphingolipid hydroxylase (fatty acid hydroxylase superfamily)